MSTARPHLDKAEEYAELAADRREDLDVREVRAQLSIAHSLIAIAKLLGR